MSPLAQERAEAKKDGGIPRRLSGSQRFFKRLLDILLSIAGLLLTGWLIVPAYLAASIDTRRNGLFAQTRIGRGARPFMIFKIRTMRDDPRIRTSVTSAGDPRITRLGRFFRKTKLDELPQFINVLLGEMSIVGPRPDVPGFADQLSGDDRIILSVKPGLIGPGTLKYVREEEELERQPDPEKFNREVIFPEKVRLNRRYVEDYSFRRDLKYISDAIRHLAGIKK